LKVEIIGHTDDVGTDEANRVISERRAKIVVDYLISKGINPARLKLSAKGKSEPIYPNDSEENRAKNRRVEFKIGNVQ
jgi:outer membrane protein OmpA-like peptidoglycan-associated protein